MYGVHKRGYRPVHRRSRHVTHSIAKAYGDRQVLSGISARAVEGSVDALLTGIMLPIFLMLLFVYVFGGALEVGTIHRDYVVPGVIVLCAGFGAASTAISIASDMQTGVMDRFRTLPTFGSSVLVGHVAASVRRNLFASAAVIGVALLIGFRPSADPLELLAAASLLLLYILAMSWVTTAIGLAVRSAEAASGATFFMLMLFLPYLSSAFVPAETMPRPLRAISENQPWTPLVEAS